MCRQRFRPVSSSCNRLVANDDMAKRVGVDAPDIRSTGDDDMVVLMNLSFAEQTKSTTRHGSSVLRETINREELMSISLNMLSDNSSRKRHLLAESLLRKEVAGRRSDESSVCFSSLSRRSFLFFGQRKFFFLYLSRAILFLHGCLSDRPNKIIARVDSTMSSPFVSMNNGSPACGDHQSWSEPPSIHSALIHEIYDVPMEDIRRPLPSILDETKVQSIMESLRVIIAIVPQRISVQRFVSRRWSPTKRFLRSTFSGMKRRIPEIITSLQWVAVIDGSRCKGNDLWKSIRCSFSELING